MTKPFVEAMAVDEPAPAARGSVRDGQKRSKPHAEPESPIKKLQRIKDEVIYWALRVYMRVLKSICNVAEATANHPQGKGQ
jgi:hypothetical protein